MIWFILYVIGTIICCGIIIYVNDTNVDDPEIALTALGGIIWPVLLIFFTIYMLGYCVSILLKKITKTK